MNTRNTLRGSDYLAVSPAACPAGQSEPASRRFIKCGSADDWASALRSKESHGSVISRKWSAQPMRQTVWSVVHSRAVPANVSDMRRMAFLALAMAAAVAHAGADSVIEALGRRDSSGRCGHNEQADVLPAHASSRGLTVVGVRRQSFTISREIPAPQSGIKQLETAHKGMTFDWEGSPWSVHEDPTTGVRPAPRLLPCHFNISPRVTQRPAMFIGDH